MPKKSQSSVVCVSNSLEREVLCVLCPVVPNRQVTRSVRCRRWDAARVLTAWFVPYILVYQFQREETKRLPRCGTPHPRGST